MGDIKVGPVNQDPVTWLVDLNALLIEIKQFADTWTSKALRQRIQTQGCSHEAMPAPTAKKKR